MKPRARLTRCCSPPEKVAGGSACSRRGMFSRSSSPPATCARLVLCGAAADQHFRHHVERRHARHHAEELADVAERVVAYGEDAARVGAGKIDHLAMMADQDAARFGAVVAVQAAHQRRFADAGRPGQHDAFARAQFEADAGQHRYAHAALQMQREAFRQRIGRSITWFIGLWSRQHFVQSRRACCCHAPPDES